VIPQFAIIVAVLTGRLNERQHRTVEFLREDNSIPRRQVETERPA